MAVNNRQLNHKQTYVNLRGGRSSRDAYLPVLTQDISYPIQWQEQSDNHELGSSFQVQKIPVTIQPQLVDSYMGQPVADAAAHSITPHPQAELSEETIVNQDPGGREANLKPTKRGTFPWALSLLAVIPINLPVAVLLVLLCKYRVKSESSIFEGVESPSIYYILVRFADTRLVLLASLLNNVTGPLSGWIMSLYAPKVAQTLRNAETKPDANHSRLNPYLMTLLGGICQASLLQQFRLSYYRISRNGEKTRENVGDALMEAARMLLLLNGLRSAFFAVVFLLHFTINTVPFDQIHTTGQKMFSPGFGLSQECLKGNIFETYFPCSYNNSSPNLASQLRQRYLLQHQMSDVATIQSVENSDLAPQALAILAPATTVVPMNIDFRANSIGVSTECSFITPICDFRTEAEFPNPDSFYTIFNCSNSFYGVLGEAAKSADGITTAGDPDVPPLCFKPSANLLLGYFVDPSLTLVYNAAGYDPATLTNSEDFGPLPVDDLVPVLYQAVAARVSLIGMTKVPENGDIFSGAYTYSEFSMRCKITTYDVEYSRIMGILQTVTSDVTSSGAVLEIFHGVQSYDVTSDTQLDIQDMMSRASLEDSLNDLRERWEQLMSVKVMSAIGAVAESRKALLQQTRETMLVAKVPWLSLILLLAVTLLQVALAAHVIISTYCKNTVMLKDQRCGNQLTTAGGPWGLFQEPAVSELSIDHAPQKSRLPTEDEPAAIMLRIKVEDRPDDHVQFVLVGPRDKNVREI